MMTDFSSVVKSIEGLDYEQLLVLAQDAYAHLRPVLKIIDAENKGVLLLVNIICTAIGADNELSELEKHFVCDAFSLDDKSLEEIVKFKGDKELVDGFADAISDEIKMNVAIIVCAIAACDKNMSRDELAYIEKIIG